MKAVDRPVEHPSSLQKDDISPGLRNMVGQLPKERFEVRVVVAIVGQE